MIITLLVNSNVVVDEGLIKREGEWEDDGVKIVKLIGQGSFDTLIGEKARKSIVKYMLGILGSISKHCKQACSLE